MSVGNDPTDVHIDAGRAAILDIAAQDQLLDVSTRDGADSRCCMLCYCRLIWIQISPPNCTAGPKGQPPPGLEGVPARVLPSTPRPTATCTGEPAVRAG